MSLLLEALKALADRPVPADGAADSTPSEQTKAESHAVPKSAEKPSQASKAQSSEIASEQLLASAASAVAESLRDEDRPDPFLANASAAQISAPAEQGTDANWASIWQQALASHEESLPDAAGTADEAPPADNSEAGEKLQSIFAPWFAAHGLANEPVDSADSKVETHEKVHSESLPAEVNPEIQAEAEPASSAAPYTPAAEHGNPNDPTWELYDRSAESLAAWGFQQTDSREGKVPTDPAVADPHTHSQTPAEYVPDSSREQVKAKEKSVDTRTAPQETYPAASERPSAPSADQKSPRKKVRPPAPSPAASMPATASTQIAAVLPSAQAIEEIRVSEPYLRLANRLLQSLRTARPQAIVLASVDEASARTLDIAQLAKAITLSEEGKLLFIQAQAGRPDLTRRLGIHPDQHPRWQGAAGSELYERIHCSSQGRIDLLPHDNLCASAEHTIDPLLIARCKRQYPLVLVDVGVVTSEVARILAPQGDAALLVAVMQHTPREVAVQSTALLRRLGVRTAGCVLMEPRQASTSSRKLAR